MKILAISDTHNQHKSILSSYLTNENDEYDMIIHAGDVSGRGWEKEIKEFLEWYDKLPFRNKIMIPGNHDFFFEKASKFIIDDLLSKYPSITYLHDTNIVIDGVKIHGSGVTPWFYNWAFNRLGEEIQPHWDMIPDDVDILVTHGPVEGYLDLTLEGKVTGCPYLKETITNRLKNLKLHVCGHIHEHYGSHVFADGQVFLNASVLNRDYKMQNRPISIELGKPESIDCGRINRKD